MDIEEKEEEFVVGVLPGNAALLSDLSEQSDELSKEISYLLGGVESYRDINHRSRFPLVITREDFSVDIKGIIERILNYLKNLVKDIFDGSTAGALALEGVLTRAERVLVDGRSIRRNHAKRDFVITTRIANLSVRYRPISDPQQLLNHLKVLNSTLRTTFTYLTHSVFTGFDPLLRFDPLVDDINELARLLQSSAPSVLADDARFSNQGFKITSPQLLGCQQLVITNRRADSSPLEQILGCYMSLETAEKEARAVPDSIKYEKFGLSLEQSIVREVISIAGTIGGYNTLNRRSLRRNRLASLTDRMSALSNQLDNGEYTSDQMTSIRNYIRVLEVYSGWIGSPYVGLIALTHRNLTAILNVCEGNAK
ncbi:virion structural protein [Pseudomonas phage Phabio]|uniref:Virion structural protein n=1 Tax=Pseudomonas phage Phabio TaxID=2006668 RepID=A0A1Y0SYF4_9CAUD|nr:internal head protein [Pseudomonas phage Phabio]ARV76773.1 virion structural protein [Pseudomonas phage Phabio]